MTYKLGFVYKLAMAQEIISCLLTMDARVGLQPVHVGFLVDRVATSVYPARIMPQMLHCRPHLYTGCV